MKPVKLTVLIGILAMIFWVPAASASTIYLLAENTPTVTIGGTPLTPTAATTQSYSGYAYYNPSEGSAGSPITGGTVTGYGGNSSLAAGHTWLTTMTARTNYNSYASYIHLQGNAPNGSITTPGFVSEAGTTDLIYTFSGKRNQVLSISDSYLYNYYLANNSVGNYFYTTNIRLTVGIYLNSTLQTTWDIFPEVTQNSGSPSIRLADFSSGGDKTGTHSAWTTTIGNNGANTVDIRITATENGATVPVPASVLLLGSGLLGVGLLRFRGRKNKS